MQESNKIENITDVFLNAISVRKKLSSQLIRESKIIREESLKVLSEFENLKIIDIEER